MANTYENEAYKSSIISMFNICLFQHLAYAIELVITTLRNRLNNMCFINSIYPGAKRQLKTNHNTVVLWFYFDKVFPLNLQSVTS